VRYAIPERQLIVLELELELELEAVHKP